jgi:hypothetical protein
MAVHFDPLRVGQSYHRPYLADLWGYQAYQALARGVVTPGGTRYIILFVTRYKQNCLTPYHDYIEGDQLFWEREERHGSDTRIVNAAYNGDEIHLFYREVHHTPFVYYGRIDLIDHRLKSGQPSVFFFNIRTLDPISDAAFEIRERAAEFQTLSETERVSLVKSRMGQGMFRYELMRLWQGCSVTGVALFPILKASHVKPWRLCSNRERLDPYNGLLLTPTLDSLFDLGYNTSRSRTMAASSCHRSYRKPNRVSCMFMRR